MSEAEDLSLAVYAEKLQGLIEDPKSGLLLDANTIWQQQFGDDLPGKAAFELTSGKFQEKFITLWELFDQRWDFNELIRMFAVKAREVRRSTPFSALVTSTATSKHIVEHVHAAIEDERDKVTVHYLGHYPFLSIENRDLLDFKGEDVLIATDAVATGTLVQKMAEIVRQVGGNPVGVLCVVLTGEELIAKPFVRVSDHGRPLRIHSMTTRSIPFLDPGSFNPKKTYKIDPVTVLPEEKLLLPNGSRPYFSEPEMFRHFESAEAIDFNFYQMDTRRITTAIRADCLLREHGDTIWSAIEEVIERGTAIVTTFNREDVRFKEFVEDRLEKARKLPKTCVFVPKKDFQETPSSYFLLPPSVEKIQNGHIILLFFSIHTSEKLRNIVSLLASYSVQSITALCLLNRMGLHTSNFVARIKRLLRGVSNGGSIDDTQRRKPSKDAKKSETTNDAHFKLISVYSLPDINSDDIVKMQQTVGALFQYYSAGTRVPSFRRWMNQDQKYFRSHSLTSRDFEIPTTNALQKGEEFALSLPEEYAYAEQDRRITVRTQEGKLALLCRYAVATRDYAPFVQEIANLPGKETLYKMFGILLSDLSYLKMTGKFGDLRSTLIEQITNLRAQRLAAEGGRRTSEIESMVDTETHLLFGLSLFSFLDNGLDYDSFILGTLTCGLSASGWIEHPENLAIYFGDERVAWSISLLLHLSHHKFRQPDVAKSLKSEMKEAILFMLRHFEEYLPDTIEHDNRNSKNRIKANLNLLLTELGAHELKAKHQVIRYLHSKVTTPRRGHNPIYSSTESALLELDRIVSLGEDSESDGTRIRISQPGTKKILEDAFYAAGILEEIAEAVRQLIFFTQTSRAEAERFANEPTLPGFSQDVVRLGNIFQSIRIENIVSKADLEILTQLRTEIFYDLWDPASYLRAQLLRYVVPFRDLIASAMEASSQVLAGYDYKNVWEREIAHFQPGPPEAWVLADPYNLREVLRNIFSNVRHSFQGYTPRKGETWISLVSTKLERTAAPAPPPETEMRDYYRLTVVSRGGRLRGVPEDATFVQHQREITSFGGSLEIQELSQEPGAIAILTLLARNAPRN